MAKQNDRMDFAQPDNQLSAYADAERAKLFPRNDYSPKTEQYSVKHKDALADGDELGRGTGGFMDIYNENAGTSTDILDRVEDLKVNKYSSNNPYYTVEQ